MAVMRIINPVDCMVTPLSGSWVLVFSGGKLNTQLICISSF
jgi:hypothetical protein